MNVAIILIGSNLHPQENIKKCLLLLMDRVTLTDRSQIWKTKSFGSEGPDFLNLALKVNTDLHEKQLKAKILRKIESKLGRVRLSDKNAPRTIDMDIVIFNNKVLDNEIWEKIYIALPVSELEPNLLDPISKKKLKEIAIELKSSEQVELYNPSDSFLNN